jgi:hypothetical protein
MARTQGLCNIQWTAFKYLGGNNSYGSGCYIEDNAASWCGFDYNVMYKALGRSLYIANSITQETFTGNIIFGNSVDAASTVFGLANKTHSKHISAGYTSAATYGYANYVNACLNLMYDDCVVFGNRGPGWYMLGSTNITFNRGESNSSASMSIGTQSNNQNIILNNFSSGKKSYNPATGQFEFVLPEKVSKRP